MGYSTNYNGGLTIRTSDSMDIIEKALGDFLGEDVRDHPEWKPLLSKNYDYIWIGLEYYKVGELRWDGGEKFNDMDTAVNLLTTLMRAKGFDFTLEGSMLCQGEEIGDLWKLKMYNGIAIREDVTVDALHTCPECGHQFKD